MYIPYTYIYIYITYIPVSASVCGFIGDDCQAVWILFQKVTAKYTCNIHTNIYNVSDPLKDNGSGSGSDPKTKSGSGS